MRSTTKDLAPFRVNFRYLQFGYENIEMFISPNDMVVWPFYAIVIYYLLVIIGVIDSTAIDCQSHQWNACSADTTTMFLSDACVRICCASYVCLAIPLTDLQHHTTNEATMCLSHIKIKLARTHNGIRLKQFAPKWERLHYSLIFVRRNCVLTSSHDKNTALSRSVHLTLRCRDRITRCDAE